MATRQTIIDTKLTAKFFFERTENLQRYQDQIRKYDVLTREQEKELFKKIKFGTKEEAQKAKDTIINSNQRFVFAVAKKFATNENLLDLINEGNIGLMEAIDKYDPSTDNRFISLAVWYIRRAIGMYTINYGAMVRRSNKLKTYHLVNKATNKFIQKEMRQPTSDELIDILRDEYNCDIKNAADIIDTVFVSIDSTYGNEDKDAYDPNVADFNTASSSENMYEKSTQDNYNRMLSEKLISTLKPIEQTIIKMLFGIGYDRAYELQEVGPKVGFTKERVRQYKISILEKLRKRYESMDIDF